jgi:carbonic anhydrase
VLGHEACGAVQAALHAKLDGTTTENPRLAPLLDAILPALEGIDPARPPEVQMQLAVERNVRRAVRQLVATRAGGAALAEGRIQIVDALYELATGKVRFLLDDAPRPGR